MLQHSHRRPRAYLTPSHLKPSRSLTRLRVILVAACSSSALAGCLANTTHLANHPCTDDDPCPSGYACHPNAKRCVPDLLAYRDCKLGADVCLAKEQVAAVRDGGACPFLGAFVPCDARVPHCDGGCRDCGEDLRWSECSPPKCQLATADNCSSCGDTCAADTHMVATCDERALICHRVCDSRYNAAPTLAADATTSFADTPVTIDVLANDAATEAEALVVLGVTPALHGSVSFDSLRITYTPESDFVGLDTVTYTAGYVNCARAEAQLTVEVKPYTAPLPADPGPVATDEDSPSRPVTLTGSDTEDAESELVVAVVVRPAHGSLDVVGGTAPLDVIYTPLPDYHGTDGFSFTLTDSHGLVSPAHPVVVHVKPVNDPPVAIDGQLEAVAEVMVIGSLQATDVDGDALIYRVARAPALGTAAITDASTGLFSFQPSTSGLDSFTFVASDGTVESSEATVTIAVAEPLLAVTDVVETAEDTAVIIVVLANDRAPDAGSLAVIAITQPSHGTASLTGSSVRYVPAADYHGPDSFTYTMQSGSGQSRTGEVSLTVTAVNDTPVADAASAVTLEDQPLSGTLTGFDVDGDTLTFAVVDSPGKTQSFVLHPVTGAYSYIPAANANGADTFSFNVTDGQSESAAATVSIAITPINDPPVAEDVTFTVYEDHELSDTLPANDDADGDAIAAYEIVDPAAHGSVNLLGDSTGKFVYIPAAEYNGGDSFTFRARDSEPGNVATVSVTVESVNDSPTVEPIAPITAPAGTRVEYIFVNADEGGGPDEDSQTLSAGNIVVVADPDAVVDTNGIGCVFADAGDGGHGELWVSTRPGVSGVADLRVRITDGYRYVDAQIVINVGGTNHPPVCFNIAASTPQDTAVQITLRADDPDNHSASPDPILVWSIDSEPRHGTVDTTSLPTLTYEPDPGFTGRDEFIYSADDGERSLPAVVTVVVGGSVLFVTDTSDRASLATADAQVYERIRDHLGYTVHLVSDAASTREDADGKDVILISSSAHSGNVETRFLDVPVPVLTWERFLYDDMLMSPPVDSDGDDPPYAGGFELAQAIDIVAPEHPYAAGFPAGLVDVMVAPENIIFGDPPPDATVVALTPKGEPALFVLETGDTLADGETEAPARRVGYFLPDFGKGELNDNGLRLLDAAVNEALAR